MFTKSDDPRVATIQKMSKVESSQFRNIEGDVKQVENNPSTDLPSFNQLYEQTHQAYPWLVSKSLASHYPMFYHYWPNPEQPTFKNQQNPPYKEEQYNIEQIQIQTPRMDLEDQFQFSSKREQRKSNRNIIEPPQRNESSSNVQNNNKNQLHEEQKIKINQPQQQNKEKMEIPIEKEKNSFPKIQIVNSDGDIFVERSPLKNDHQKSFKQIQKPKRENRIPIFEEKDLNFLKKLELSHKQLINSIQYPQMKLLNEELYFDNLRNQWTSQQNMQEENKMEFDPNKYLNRDKSNTNFNNNQQYPIQKSQSQQTLVEDKLQLNSQVRNSSKPIKNKVRFDTSTSNHSQVSDKYVQVDDELEDQFQETIIPSRFIINEFYPNRFISLTNENQQSKKQEDESKNQSKGISDKEIQLYPRQINTNYLSQSQNNKEIQVEFQNNKNFENYHISDSDFFKEKKKFVAYKCSIQNSQKKKIFTNKMLDPKDFQMQTIPIERYYSSTDNQKNKVLSNPNLILPENRKYKQSQLIETINLQNEEQNEARYIKIFSEKKKLFLVDEKSKLNSESELLERLRQKYSIERWAYNQKWLFMKSEFSIREKPQIQYGFCQVCSNFVNLLKIQQHTKYCEERVQQHKKQIIFSKLYFTSRLSEEDNLTKLIKFNYILYMEYKLLTKSTEREEQLMEYCCFILEIVEQIITNNQNINELKNDLSLIENYFEKYTTFHQQRLLFVSQKLFKTVREI